MSRIDAGVNDLIQAILQIPGNKIVTLAIEGEEPFVIDISAKGKFGYHKSHELLFKIKLMSAFRNSGGLIIRQFLSIKVERKTPSGKMIWIPKKNIYGVQIINGSWKPVPRHEVKRAHCTDADSGKPIPCEKDVFFLDFPV